MEKRLSHYILYTLGLGTILLGLPVLYLIQIAAQYRYSIRVQFTKLLLLI